MTSHCLWRFKLISGYILSLLQGFCVYRSRPKTDRSVRSNPIHGPINGPIDWSGLTPSQKSSVLCIGLDRGPDRTEVVHPWQRIVVFANDIAVRIAERFPSDTFLQSLAVLNPAEWKK